MPDPHDTLAIFAEVSVALAGFSGIAIAVGKRSIESLTGQEVRRFTNLFVLSGAALVLSLTGASLLHIDMSDPAVIWRWGSGISAIAGALWLARDVCVLLRLQPFEKAALSIPLIVGFDSMYVVIILLQIANCIYWKEPWPFFLVLVILVIAAFQQFILLVWTGVGREAEPD